MYLMHQPVFICRLNSLANDKKGTFLVEKGTSSPVTVTHGAIDATCHKAFGQDDFIAREKATRDYLLQLITEKTNDRSC